MDLEGQVCGFDKRENAKVTPDNGSFKVILLRSKGMYQMGDRVKYDSKSLNPGEFVEFAKSHSKIDESHVKIDLPLEEKYFPRGSKIGYRER